MTVINRFLKSQRNNYLKSLQHQHQSQTQPISSNAKKLLRLKPNQRKRLFLAMGPDLMSDNDIEAGSWNAFIEAHIVDITTGKVKI